MIIPFKNSLGEIILHKHLGPKGKTPLSLFVKHFHKNGCYPVYRTLCNDKIKVYRNKTFNQTIGIISRLG